MSYLFKQKEIGDYRISIYQDDCAECPCTAWDLTGLYMWEYPDCHKLSEACDWKELFGGYDTNNHSIEDALKKLVCEYVPEKKIIDYINSDACNKKYRMRYDKSERVWHFEFYWTDEIWHEECSFTPSELRDYDNREEFCEVLDEDDFKYLLRNCKDIAFYEWSSTGYCQGDYVGGFAYCDKERFSKMCDTDTKNWRKRALDIFEGEVEDIGLWMWGDVKGYILEKKVPYKKVFTKIVRKPVDGYDWEEVDSCWGEFYDDADDLIEDVIKEYDILRMGAA